MCYLGKVDLLAFVKMKCYATALANVPIEISSLSPLDAGRTAQITRLERSTPQQA